MTTQSRLMTAADLLAMPDDGMRHELVRGVLTTMAPAGEAHGTVSGAVGALFARRLSTKRYRFHGGDPGFWTETDPDSVRAPDFALTRRERLPSPGSAYGRTLPDLVLETVSPNDTRREVDEKARMWLDAGVGVVLVADPQRRSIRVIRPNGEERLGIDDVARFPEFDGIEFPVADCFD